jgi:hypothetical protein
LDNTSATNPVDEQSNVASDAEYVVHIVHGTFDRSSKWAGDDSVLRAELSIQLRSKVEFVRHKWSAWNTHRSRTAGALKLSENVRAAVDKNPTASHFIIAHSHGGNIALSALRTDELQQAVKGIVCVNTPFYHVTSRQVDFFSLFLLRNFGLAIVFYAAIFAVFAFLSPQMREEAPKMFSDAPTYALIIFAAIFLTALVAGIYFAARPSRVASCLADRQRRAIESTRLPQNNFTPVLCLWTAADEVFELFLILEGITAIPFFFLQKSFLYFVYGAAASIVIFIFFTTVFAVLDGRMDPLGVLLSAPLFMLFFGLATATVVAFVAFTAYYFGFILNILLRLIPMGFGIASAFNSLFVRTSFGRVPLTATHIRFVEIASPPMFLNHSGLLYDRDTMRLASRWLANPQATHFP